MAGRWICIVAVVSVAWASLAYAEAPDRSIRPMPRDKAPSAVVPPTIAPVVSDAVAPAVVPKLRPRARPVLAGMAQAPAAILSAPADLAPVPVAAVTKATLRPRPRPFVMAEAAGAPPAPQVLVAAFVNGLHRSLRPLPRPAFAAVPAPQAQDTAVPVQTASAAPAPRRGGLFGLFAPRPRAAPPEGELQETAATRIEPGREPVVSRKGSVCGVNAIKGETLAPIPAKTQGCGIPEPVRVTNVGGIQLSTPATINCATAIALHQWVKQAVEPVYGKGKVVELKVAASYACRPRNNIRGAKISEHGRGNAIDISGLTLSNGKTYMVRGDFDKKMRQAHRAACGIFGTTLGPGSDGYHEDHMHFDVANHRSGPYCR